MMQLNEECRICGSEDFIIIGNRHQCALCATFVEVKVKKGESKKKRKKQECSPKTVPVVPSCSQEQTGRLEKWTTYEAFNVIIKKQVDALVSFGANKRLHEVVLQLWAYYLQLTDVAFPDVPKTSAASYLSIPRNRDYHMYNSESANLPHRRIAMFPRKKPVRERRPKQIGASKKTKSKRKKDDSICEGDMPLILAYMDDIKEELKNHGDLEGENEKLGFEERLQHARQLFSKSEKSVHQNVVKQVEYMCMFKTVAFCYLGILLLEDCILLGDIRRWIREGHFPYLEAANLLPPSMKLQGLDFLAFKQPGPPSSKDVRYAAGRLAYFLGIKELQRPPLAYIVARFLGDLNLPAELNTIVCSFMDAEPAQMEWGKNTYKISRSSKPGAGVNLSVPNYEARAVGYIAVVLKLLFGLDGHTEKEISSYGQKLSKLKRIGKKVFVWNEWVQHINLKLDFLKNFHSPCTVSESDCEVADVNNLHQFFRSSMAKWHQSSEIVKQRTYHNHKQSCSSIHQLLADLNNLKEDSSSLVWPPTSFPFTQAASQFSSKFDNKNCVLVQNFHGKTLSYLTHPYLWQCYAEKRCTVPGEVHVVNSEFKHFTALNYRYWFHDVKINYLNTFFIAELPESFQWLLMVLCHCTEVRLTEIYAEVVLIEKIVLGCGKTSRAQRMKLKTNYW